MPTTSSTYHLPSPPPPFAFFTPFSRGCEKLKIVKKFCIACCKFRLKGARVKFASYFIFYFLFLAASIDCSALWAALCFYTSLAFSFFIFGYICICVLLFPLLPVSSLSTCALFCLQQFIQIEFATAAITQSELRNIHSPKKMLKRWNICCCVFVRYTALDGRSDSAKAGVDGSILMASRKPQKCVSHKNKTPTTTTILKYTHTHRNTHTHTHTQTFIYNKCWAQQVELCDFGTQS